MDTVSGETRTVAESDIRVVSAIVSPNQSDLRGCGTDIALTLDRLKAE